MMMKMKPEHTQVKCKYLKTFSDSGRNLDISLKHALLGGKISRDSDMHRYS
jgi:hypothetical protein